MKQPYVSTLIEQDFTSAEKALGRKNIDAISSADLEGYATQEWVQDQNYLTSADIPDVSDMATKTWTSENFYPDTNPSGFVTSSWVAEQNYITSADVPAAQEYSAGQYVSIVDHVVSVTGLQPEGDYLTRDESSSFLTSADLPDLTDYVTSADVSGFVDKSYVENNFYAASNPSGFLTSADIPHTQQVQSDWAEENVSVPSYIQNKPGPVGLEAISPLYFIDETSASKIGIYTSAIPELSGYATKSYVDENFYSASNPSGFLTSADLPELSGYATKSYVENNFYSASNPSGFITSSDLPDLSEYATIQYVDNSINSATSGKQEKLTFGYTDNKISSINSSAIYCSGGNDGSEIYRKPYGGSETLVSALKINLDDPDGYAYVTADDVGQGYLVQGPYKKLLDAGINSGYGVGDSATPVYIDNNGTFKPVSGILFTQEQSDWTEANTASASYIKNKPTPVGLTAGPGITITDNGSSIEISSSGSGSGYATVECHPLSVEYSGYVKVVYPQSSACCELHVTTPHRYDVAEYSAKIDDDKTWAIPSGAWYDFVKQDLDGTVQWCFKDSGIYYG